MIRISDIEVRGRTAVHEFYGHLPLESGLNVISAKNGYGKSLAGTTISWCLGVEVMFGLQNNDAARFPEAVRDIIELEGLPDLPVLNSSCSVRLLREDQMSLRISRSIHGGDLGAVTVEEIDAEGSVLRESRLEIHKATMKDEAGGFQNFLFRWLGLPRQKLVDRSGGVTEVYLENLVPLFVVDQSEGWVDIQALQVFRYGQQDVKEASFEFLLGQEDLLAARFEEQQRRSRETQLAAQAAQISERVEATFSDRGYTIRWSDHGRAEAIAARWSEITLQELAKRNFALDLGGERALLRRQITALREKLSAGDLSEVDRADSERASQRVIDLKTRRHELQLALRKVRIQAAEQRLLYEGIQSRTQSSQDVLRLKQTGIGRFDHVECPTCHRDLEPESFQLTQQSAASVEAHIDALKRDGRLIRSNIGELQSEERKVAANLESVEDDLRSAQRSLSVVSQTSSVIVEQLGKAAGDLADAERKLDRNRSFEKEISLLQQSVDDWISRASAGTSSSGRDADENGRLKLFRDNLTESLVAWGHSAVTETNRDRIRLDESYTPYLGPRRLRSLGSASDHPRLVASYSLALARTASAVQAPHPGFVILDEPLQQNPDEDHREKFLDYLLSLEGQASHPFQTIIFTYLLEDEVRRLREAGVEVATPTGAKFLKVVAKEKPVADPGDSSGQL